MKSLEVEGSPCDAASYDVDDVFLERLERAMQGLETLALERQLKAAKTIRQRFNSDTVRSSLLGSLELRSLSKMFGS